jgi:TonB dependent receptor
VKVAPALALLAASLGEARADPRDVFGLAPKTEKPLDCSDGTDFGCVRATDPLGSDVSPFALSTFLSAKYLLTLPVADATHDMVAGYALGSSRDEAGVNFAGANGLENRWTINGAPADNIKTGGVDTKIPLTFLDGIRVTAGGFAARDRTSTGGTIDAQLRGGTKDHELEAHVWFGLTANAAHAVTGPDVYLVQNGSAEAGPDLSSSIVATGPITSESWYVLGIAPEIARTNYTFHSQRLRDLDNDMVPDGAPGVLDTDPIETSTSNPINYNIPILGRIGFDRGPHHLDLSIVGSIADATRYIQNATLQAGGVDAQNIVGDAIATYRGEWKDTRVHLQIAEHHSSHTESARTSDSANVPQLLTAYVPDPLAQDPLLGQYCSDGENDPYPNIANCPVPLGWFESGGAGLLQDTHADRLSITADVAHRIDNNTLRTGVTLEDSSLVTDSRFTGDEQIRSLFVGEQSIRHFVSQDQTCSADLSQPCPYTDVSELAYRTIYGAAYAEDTWQAAPNITVNAGVRYELMWVGPILHFSNQWAPRLGMVWDPLGEGRSRVWVSMGRSYAMLPAGLGNTILVHDRTVDELTFNGTTTRAVDTGEALLVDSGVQPIAQDELTAGAEVALLRQLRARIWAQGRWLRRGLESTPEGFDNPGRVDGMPALRDTELLAVELESNPIAKFVLRVGYLWGHTTGSWTGAFDPRSGAALYNSPDFDVTSVNQNGLLPTDMGSRLYFEAQRRGTIGPVDMSVSTRFTVASGRPRDAMGDGDDGLVYLIDRGEYARGPLQTQANVRVAATYAKFSITLDLFNLFDRRDATNINTVYAGGSIRPIEGGTSEDLVFLRTDDGDSPGRPATRSQTYGQGTAFQAPFSAVLGVHRSF